MQEEEAKEASYAFSIVRCRGTVFRRLLHFASEDDEVCKAEHADVVQQEVAGSNESAGNLGPFCGSVMGEILERLPVRRGQEGIVEALHFA